MTGRVPKIAFDVSATFGPRTGVGVAVASTLAALETVATTGDIELHQWVLSTRAAVSSEQHRLPIPAAFAVRWWGRSTRPHLDRLLGSPDLVHGTNYVVPPTRCPRVVSVYDVWFLGADQTQIAPDVRRAGQALRRAVGDGAHVVVSSAATARGVIDRLGADPTRVHTIHLGPPPVGQPTLPLPTELADRRFVLALGTVERRKNLTTLVDAFARLPGSLDIDLVIAGADGDDSDAVANRLASFGTDLARRVHRLGHVDARTKAALLSGAHVLAYPSLDEGFGFPLLEAQSARVPVVASSGGSIPEVAGDGALIVDAHDVTGLALALERAIVDEDLRDELTAAGTSNLERFSWTSTALALVDLYRHLTPSST